MTHESLIAKYSLEKDKLLFLYDCIACFLKERGVSISYINLEPVVETDIYKIDREIKDDEKHHESCISDGKEIYLHYDMEVEIVHYLDESDFLSLEGNEFIKQLHDGNVIY